MNLSNNSGWWITDPPSETQNSLPSPNLSGKKPINPASATQASLTQKEQNMASKKPTPATKPVKAPKPSAEKPVKAPKVKKPAPAADDLGLEPTPATRRDRVLRTGDLSTARVGSNVEVIAKVFGDGKLISEAIEELKGSFKPGRSAGYEANPAGFIRGYIAHAVKKGFLVEAGE